MNIIIEIKKGIVYGVYKQGRWSKRLPDIVVIDLDVGERVEPNWWTLMPIEEADKATQKAMRPRLTQFTR